MVSTTKGSRILAIAAPFAFCLLVLVVLGLNDFSGGTDAGIHYAFGEELLRTRQWPLPPSSSMAGIAHYPPASHVASALIGSIAGSTLYGLYVITAVSFAAIYLVLGELLRFKDAQKTFSACCIFLALSAISRSGRFVEGNEVITNFFFAHFVGTAALLCGFLFLHRLRFSFAWRLFTAMILTHLIGWVYTISAIEFSLACVALEFLTVLRAPSWRTVTKLAVSATLLGLAALAHPAIIGAISIAGNDGGISVSLLTLIASASTLFIGITVLERIHRFALVNHDTLVALSLAVLAACALQSLALGVLNLGSLYAIKKYGFLLGTMAIVVWSAIIAQMLPEAGSRRLALATWPMLGLFGIASLVILTIGRSRSPVADLIAYDRQVRELVAIHPELLRQSVSWNSEQSAHANYVVGIAVLQPSELSDQHAVFAPIQFAGAAKLVVLERSSAGEFTASCVQATSRHLVAVRSECFLPSARSGKLTR